MPHYLYKLSFDTPVHFGADHPGISEEKTTPTCHSDTFFSALCQEALLLFGADYVEFLVQKARSRSFLISDLFPYNKDGELFFPKPALVVDRENTVKKEDYQQKKKIKKMSFIPLSRWNDYLSFIKGISSDYQIPDNKVYEESIQPNVFIRRRKDNPEDENQPYYVGSHSFYKGCGLFFIAFFEDDALYNEFNKILKSLQYSGIGGERSSGYGKFHYGNPIKMKEAKDEIASALFKLLTGSNFPYYMALSVISPKNGEFTRKIHKDSFYTLIPRKGFVGSASYSTTPLKKKPLVMFGSGSCFPDNLEGEVKNVSPINSPDYHNVYRYGKAMMMGVDV